MGAALGYALRVTHSARTSTDYLINIFAQLDAHNSGEWLPVVTLQASGSAWGAIREAFLRIVMHAGPKPIKVGQISMEITPAGGSIVNGRQQLMRFLDDGDIPIDNNWNENRIRPIAQGRSAWLFAGSLRAGQRGAAIMSLIQSAKLNGHDPYAYLKDVLTRLPTQPASRIEELLPHLWQNSATR